MSNCLPPLAPFSNSILPQTPLHQPSQKQQQQLHLPQTHPHHSDSKKAIISLRYKLSQLCKQGHLDIASSIFKTLPHPIPTILYNTLLIGYVSNSMPYHALKLYTLFNLTTQLADHYTYSSTLKACTDTQQLKLGKSIHCRVLRSAYRTPKNPVLNNSLLSLYATCGTRDETLLVFDRMPRRNVVSWNIMIAWYVRKNMPQKALTLFRRMIEAGVQPTSVTFVNVMPAVVGVTASKKWGDLIHGIILKCGNEVYDDVFVISSVIFMYVELFNIKAARLVFDSAKQKNIEIWNTMIGGYVRNDDYDEAIDLFFNVLELAVVSADSVTFLYSLMAVSQKQDVRLGKQIHGYLIKKWSSDSLPLILRNALIVMYSRCRCVQLAFDLFQQTTERDMVTWNTMISAFVQKKLNLEGILLVYEMQKQGFSVDSVTVSSLLSAASNLGNIKIGKETHGCLIRHEIGCEGLDSYLIDMYSKSGCVEKARQVFDFNQSKERDQVTWNAMIAGYVQNGLTEDALHIFKNMINEEHQTPNSVSIASILPACDAMHGLQIGKGIHAFSIRQFIDSNVFVGTALVDMYSRCGEISLAERVFKRMEERNKVTYTTMLSGFGQHGLGKRALSLFDSMQVRDLRPDSVTFIALLSACSYSGLVEEGLALYRSMSEYGISTSPEHSCCVVDMLGRVGRVDEAYEFVESVSKGENEVNAGVWGALLSACRVHQRYELAKVILKRMIDMGLIKDDSGAGYHVLISNVYAEEGRWGEADGVRKGMRDAGLMKEPGLSWIDMGDSSHGFMSGDRRHQECVSIYDMIDDLGEEMRLSDYADVRGPSVNIGVSELD